jgi:hypothetical protein
MNMINRGAILLRYWAPAIRWISEADPYDSPELTSDDLQRDQTVYPVSDEDGGETRRPSGGSSETSPRSLSASSTGGTSTPRSGPSSERSRSSERGSTWSTTAWSSIPWEERSTVRETNHQRAYSAMGGQRKRYLSVQRSLTVRVVIGTLPRLEMSSAGVKPLEDKPFVVGPNQAITLRRLGGRKAPPRRRS